MSWDYVNNNVLSALQGRECYTSFGSHAQQRYGSNQHCGLKDWQWQFNDSFVRNLKTYCEFIGHTGCVNRLDWNDSGTLLASGSDDRTVRIWKPFDYYYRVDEKLASEQMNFHHRSGRRHSRFLSQFLGSDSDNDNNNENNASNENNENKSNENNYSQRYRKEILKGKIISRINTLHDHNIFGVRFIPGTLDRMLCSGSMDNYLMLHSLDREQTICTYAIHSDRVKDVQICKMHPLIFYSVSEDGTIRRFDTRINYKQIQKHVKLHLNNKPMTHVRYTLSDVNSNHNGDGFDGNVIIHVLPKQFDNNRNNNKNNNNFVLLKNGTKMKFEKKSRVTQHAKKAAKKMINRVKTKQQQLKQNEEESSNDKKNENKNDAEREDSSKNKENEDDDQVTTAALKQDGDSDVMSSSSDEMSVENEESDHENSRFHRNKIEERENRECKYLKGLSINPLNGYEFAVACGDEFVRIYDTRMNRMNGMNGRSNDNSAITIPCEKVTPPHFSKERNSLWNQDITKNPLTNGKGNEESSRPKHNCCNKSINTTFVEYSKDGSEMVVTYHKENVYLFKTRNYDESIPLECFLSKSENNIDDDVYVNSSSISDNYKNNSMPMTNKTKAESLKKKEKSGKNKNIKEEEKKTKLETRLIKTVTIFKELGKCCFQKKQFEYAIHYYSICIKNLQIYDKLDINNKNVTIETLLKSKILSTKGNDNNNNNNLNNHVSMMFLLCQLYCNRCMAHCRRCHFNDNLFALNDCVESIDILKQLWKLLDRQRKWKQNENDNDSDNDTKNRKDNNNDNNLSELEIKIFEYSKPFYWQIKILEMLFDYQQAFYVSDLCHKTLFKNSDDFKSIYQKCEKKMAKLTKLHSKQENDKTTKTKKAKKKEKKKEKATKENKQQKENDKENEKGNENESDKTKMETTSVNDDNEKKKEEKSKEKLDKETETNVTTSKENETNEKKNDDNENENENELKQEENEMINEILSDELKMNHEMYDEENDDIDEITMNGNKHRNTKDDLTFEAFLDSCSNTRCYKQARLYNYTFSQRYIGHCNLKTDIKEAAFFGNKYICSGSDDGNVFVWNKESGKLINILRGVDNEVVNTVRCHPYLPILAMSGIDSTIKLWSPFAINQQNYKTTHKFTHIIAKNNVKKEESKHGNASQEKDSESNSAAKEEKDNSQRLKIMVENVDNGQINEDPLNNNSNSSISNKEEDGDDDDNDGGAGNDDSGNNMEQEMLNAMNENEALLSRPQETAFDLSDILLWANLLRRVRRMPQE